MSWPVRGIAAARHRLEIAGVVETVGAGVTDVAPGDRIIGVPVYAGGTSAGLAEQAVLKAWTPLPHGLDPVRAAALPMVVETAVRHLDALGIDSGSPLVVNGGPP